MISHIPTREWQTLSINFRNWCRFRNPCKMGPMKCLTVLLENSAVTGIVELSMRLIRDWPVNNIPDSSQMDTKWKYFALCGLPSVSISLFIFLRFPSFVLTLFILRSPTLPSILSTMLMYNAEPNDTTQTRNTQIRTTGRQCAEEIACVAYLRPRRTKLRGVR